MGKKVEQLPGHYLDYDHNEIEDEDLEDKVEPEEKPKPKEKKKIKKFETAEQYNKTLNKMGDLLDKVKE